MSRTKRILWQNYDLEVPADYIADHPEMSGEEVQQSWTELNDDYLDDERTNLKIQLANPILVIADVGRWNGRVMGYKVINSGLISDIFYSGDCDYCEWYSDGYNIRFRGSHHDGNNSYVYREIKDADKLDLVTSAIYSRHPNVDKIIARYTRSILPEIKKVYGW